MPNSSYFEPQAPAPGLMKIDCTFKPAGTGAPTGLTGKGVASVSRTGVGVFRLVLSTAYAALISGQVALMLNAAGSEVAELAAEDVDGSTPYVDIRIVDKSAGAAADVAAHANNRVHVSLTLRNTSSWS